MGHSWIRQLCTHSPVLSRTCVPGVRCMRRGAAPRLVMLSIFAVVYFSIWNRTFYRGLPASIDDEAEMARCVVAPSQPACCHALVRYTEGVGLCRTPTASAVPPQVCLLIWYLIHLFVDLNLNPHHINISFRD
jgi:hypothetical protein